VQFVENAGSGKQRERLVNMILYVPKDPNRDDADDDALAGGEELQREIVERAGIRAGANAGSSILVFDEKVGTFLTPRGRYSIKMFDSYMQLSGKTYDYQIMYTHIARLFLLPMPENRGNNIAFVISLSVPIRQGQQRYAHLVMQVPIKAHTLAVSLDEAEIEERFGPDSLAPEMEGDLHKLLAKAFKVLTKRKIYTVGRFVSDGGDKSVRCALKSNDGMLFPLQKSFFFIHKPPTFIPFDSIVSVEFQRYSGTHASAARSFDLCVTSNTGKDYVFTSIDRKEYSNLFAFLQSKNIRIKNIRENSGDGGANLSDAGEDSAGSESDDSDFNASDFSEGGSSEEDSDFNASGSDSENEGGKKRKESKENKKGNKGKKSSKKSKKRKASSDKGGSGKKKREE
jgi:structure-specific recognition protein 1